MQTYRVARYRKVLRHQSGFGPDDPANYVAFILSSRIFVVAVHKALHQIPRRTTG